jgi:hypothetical protein
VFIFSDMEEDNEATLVKKGKKEQFLLTQKLPVKLDPKQEALRLALCKTLSKETLAQKIKEVIGK